ncbi:RluA family pseudouridine synthase [Cetobacterium sp. 2A]|uniref:RluA family pseudouridine synthase n=1 Tax=unclassified Cetobacterium TaxID=2630983 RepID=UPI00163C19E5|nr:RluA family pseudouridine synthase [Cetobacterium sp. 2A]MBC2854997.1 RluA family pseudouridine synthase [Cetobacterium sp. 2A]
MVFLLEKLEGQSRNNIKTLLTKEQILVNGQVVKQYNHSLKSGDEVSVIFSKSREEKALQGIKIIYEDDALIAIEKNSGMLSIASDKEKEKTAYSILKENLKKKNPRNKIFIVHRLDKDTSGVMIFAKSEDIQKKLQENWNEIVKERTYVAVVEGTVKEDKGTIKSWLKENKAHISYSTFSENDGGKLAVTAYKVIGRRRGYSLVEAELETGRKNQIRVHMKDLGHSVTGDKKYGAEKNPIKRLGLHAKTIKFQHPVTDKIVTFSSDIPESFLKMFK